MRPTSNLVVVSIVLLAAGACSPSGAEGTTTTTTAPSTTTTAPATTTTEPEPFVYRIGLTEAPTTDNFWAAYDPQSILPDQYVLAPTKPSLYTYDLPGQDLAADLAAPATTPEPVEEEDGTWTITVPLRSDARWSDGRPITSADVVFTFEAVRDLELPGGWDTAFPIVEESSAQLGLVAVEAPDPDTVVFRYNGEPGLPFWPNGPGTAPIMPSHFWQEAVDEAQTSSDPATTLFAWPGEGDPSGGPLTVTGFGSTRVVAEPNVNYHRRGDEVTSGGVTYRLGPFVDGVEYHVFAGQREALAALADGTVDIVLSPAGLDRPGAGFAVENPDLTMVRNETNSFRYLAFNLRRPPMSSRQFRAALDVMIDRRFMVDQLLQGEAYPLYSTISPANPRWYDGDEADSFAAETGGMSTEERLVEAVRLLEEGGFTWEQTPAFVDNAVVPGSGLMLDGEPVPPIRLWAPGEAFDPQRATYALWIGHWAEQLGFDVDVELTDFTSLVGTAFTPTADGEDIDFDMYVLGWRIPSPALPVYHESFWGSGNDTLVNNGNNNTGFSDGRFDTFVEEFNGERSESEALDILWEMERIIFEEKPYLVLFDTGIAEAYRNDRVEFPFTRLVSGLQSGDGLPAMVVPIR